MVDMLLQYGLFLAKAITVVIAAMFVIITVANLGERRRHSEDDGDIEIMRLNDRYEHFADVLRMAVLDKAEFKAFLKSEKDREKAESKKDSAKTGDEAKGRRRIFVIHFNGDMRASATDNLRQEITAILTMAEARDEVVVCLESPGGMVHGYGLAASQLARIRQNNVPLTICVDKVAASGGYMMACLGNTIMAAPFAIVGSIGVVAQIPNFHRLLDKWDIDFEVLTAGEYKRTLTVFGENTDAGREKFVEELEDTHTLFKDFVKDYRPALDIAKVATGEHWYGRRAVDLGLIDKLMTSDEYLQTASKEADIFAVRFVQKVPLLQRVGLVAASSLDRVLLGWWERLVQRPRF
ncbi:serine protease SohB [Fluviicoccus keumensis]|uniref:Serine protease SohB n=1 Tax=Fluviicoccus keumensis TaxID=1435465 RepID=A0A4Q7YIP3_9GAMM|nr:protease SohB [Fluviicoccus keumensis]RZU37100.1 serine protease SohB [Fluviicoccus keumensis]